MGASVLYPIIICVGHTSVHCDSDSRAWGPECVRARVVLNGSSSVFILFMANEREREHSYYPDVITAAEQNMLDGVDDL